MCCLKTRVLENLAIWSNFAALPDLKVVISSVIAESESEISSSPRCLVRVFSSARTAFESLLKDSVAAREPNGFWQTRLREFVDTYHRRSGLRRLQDLVVDTQVARVTAVASDDVERTYWGPTRQSQ